MKRYYISPVIGDGSFENPYRAEMEDTVAANQGSMSVVIKNNPDGTPAFPFALCIVSSGNHVPFESIAGTDRFPDITLDSTLSVLTPGQRSVVLNFLSNRGVDTSGLGPTSTFGEVIERIGGHIDGNFRAINFDAN